MSTIGEKMLFVELKKKECFEVDWKYLDGKLRGFCRKLIEFEKDGEKYGIVFNITYIKKG
jgi:hypothetical protein